MQRWGKVSQQEFSQYTGAIEAPLTNHSGKNACHFPASGTDSASSQMCDLIFLTWTAGCQQEEQNRKGAPKQTCTFLCWQPWPWTTSSSSIRTVSETMSGQDVPVWSCFFAPFKMISPDVMHVKLIRFHCNSEYWHSAAAIYQLKDRPQGAKLPPRVLAVTSFQSCTTELFCSKSL